MEENEGPCQHGWNGHGYDLVTGDSLESVHLKNHMNLVLEKIFEYPEYPLQASMENIIFGIILLTTKAPDKIAAACNCCKHHNNQPRKNTPTQTAQLPTPKERINAAIFAGAQPNESHAPSNNLSSFGAKIQMAYAGSGLKELIENHIRLDVKQFPGGYSIGITLFGDPNPSFPPNIGPPTPGQIFNEFYSYRLKLYGVLHECMKPWYDKLVAHNNKINVTINQLKALTDSIDQEAQPIQTINNFMSAINQIENRHKQLDDEFVNLLKSNKFTINGKQKTISKQHWGDEAVVLGKLLGVRAYAKKKYGDMLDIVKKHLLALKEASQTLKTVVYFNHRKFEEVLTFIQERYGDFNDPTSEFEFGFGFGFGYFIALPLQYQLLVAASIQNLRPNDLSDSIRDHIETLCQQNSAELKSDQHLGSLKQYALGLLLSPPEVAIQNISVVEYCYHQSIDSADSEAWLAYLYYLYAYNKKPEKYNTLLQQWITQHPDHPKISEIQEALNLAKLSEESGLFNRIAIAFNEGLRDNNWLLPAASISIAGFTAIIAAPLYLNSDGNDENFDRASTLMKVSTASAFIVASGCLASYLKLPSSILRHKIYDPLDVGEVSYKFGQALYEIISFILLEGLTNSILLYPIYRCFLPDTQEQRKQFAFALFGAGYFGVYISFVYMTSKECGLTEYIPSLVEPYVTSSPRLKMITNTANKFAFLFFINYLILSTFDLIDAITGRNPRKFHLLLWQNLFILVGSNFIRHPVQYALQTTASGVTSTAGFFSRQARKIVQPDPTENLAPAVLTPGPR